MHLATSIRRPSALLLVALLVAATLQPGCSAASKRRMKFQTIRTSYRLALEAEDGDERRDAVVRIAESGSVATDDAFHVLDAVARSDPVTQIRCIAIRAFKRYDDARPIATLLAILAAEAGSSQALPPDADVQWEIAQSLDALLERDAIADEQRDAVRQALLQMSGADSPRNVRIVALSALANFKHRDVFTPLIGGLRERDFAVAERSELSLIALTGVTHDFDPDAWDAWLAEADDPFAHAGEQPDIPRPTGPTWWDQQKRAWRRAFRLPEE